MKNRYFLTTVIILACLAMMQSVYSETFVSPINLAKRSAIYSSSDENPALSVLFANDGDLTTRWSSQYADNQSITIVLPTIQTINRVVLYWESAFGLEYKIQVSTDSVVWTDVYSTAKGDGKQDNITFADTPARYVKMNGIKRGTAWGFSLNEFEVYCGCYANIGENPKVIALDDKPVRFPLSATGSSSVSGDYYWTLGDTIKQGKNVVFDLKVGSYPMNLKVKHNGFYCNDSTQITVVKQVTVPIKLSPSRGVFYKNTAYDITVQILLNGDKLQKVVSNNVTIKHTLKTNAINTTKTSGDSVSFNSDFITLSKESLSKLPAGKNILKFHTLKNTYTFELEVKDKAENSGLVIITPDVSHGNATIIILPTGRVLLVDCGKSTERDSLLIPILKKNNIKQIDYFFITHYHGDHDSDDKGAKIKSLYNVNKFYDYKSFKTYQVFDFEGTKLTILNTYPDGSDENTSSLAFRLEYNGFVYLHSADNYAVNQDRIAREHPELVESHVFFGNHHFHGSISPSFIKKVNPYIVLLQSEQAIYARDAYADQFQKEVEPYLRNINPRKYIECIPAVEVGMVVVRAKDSTTWSYETYYDQLNVKIPGLTLKQNADAVPDMIPKPNK